MKTKIIVRLILFWIIIVLLSGCGTNGSYIKNDYTPSYDCNNRPQYGSTKPYYNHVNKPYRNNDRVVYPPLKCKPTKKVKRKAIIVDGNY